MNAIAQVPFLATKSDPSVLDFAVWWLRHRPISPPENPLRKLATFHGIVLYREGQFQVQLFSTIDFGAVPHHTHPNVETLERLLCGNVDLNTARANSSRRGFLEIPVNEDHWGSIENGAFFSFQKWLNGVPPSSVDLDWVGAPMDGQHARELQHDDMTPQMLAHWDRLRPLIVKALPFLHGTYDESDLLEHISDGRLSFWPSDRAFVIASLNAHPRKTILNVLLANGDADEIDMLIGLAAEWGKSLGATAVTSAIRPALERYAENHPPGWKSDGWKRISYNYMKDV